MPLTCRKRNKIEDILAVHKFRDVSPVELAGFSPEREIDYEINQLLQLNSFSKSQKLKI